MKLWQKEGSETTALTEKFTVGRDREFDMLLAPYDVQGSIAHVQMLAKVGLMEDAEKEIVVTALEVIAQEIRDGKFAIQNDVEDVHSQVELLLTERIGDAGKRIHAGRSRNDQVAVDIKLYLRDALKDIRDGVGTLVNLLLDLSDRYKDVLLPGYTHLQIAMPSSVGMWLGAYAECLTEDMEMLAGAYAVVDKNPLGSGAGYGSSFPLDREMTTQLLHFRTMHYNSIAAQMGRGRTEKMVAMALSCMASTMGRMAMDICLYVGQNFGFFKFPDSLTTGSSIMPHKKNPDIFELIRGKCNRIQALPNEMTLLLANLPAGYHRDMQLTKEILFPGIELFNSCVEMMLATLPHLDVNEDILSDPKYQYLFSVEVVNELVQQGLPFREAYRKVGNDIAVGTFAPSPFNPATHTHEGSVGNLCNDQIREEWEQVAKKIS